MSDKETLVSDEVAGIGKKGEVVSIDYLKSEDLAKLTDVEDDDDLGGATSMALGQTRSVRIDETRNEITEEPPANEEEEEENEQVYTVEDAINKMGFGPFQILVTIFAGMVWISDAMEVMLLSVLSPIVTCDWDLEDWQEAMITSVVFVGFFFGGLFWGAIADIIGRKKVLLIVTIEILIFGLASAAAPEYYTLLLFRCMAGFGIGGTAQAVTYYVEFLPKKLRGVCIVLLEVWWGIGSVLAALLALGIIPNIPDPIDDTLQYYSHLNWRIYVGVCALPMAIVLVFFLFVPESARYYIARGQNEKGEKVILGIARMNFRPPPPGRLVSQEEKERLENIKQTEEPETLPDNPTIMQSTESSFMDEQSAPLLNEHNSPPPNYSEEDEKLMDEANLTRMQRFKNKTRKIFIKIGQDLSVLFTGGMWKTSILLFIIWFGCAWLYYGAILLTTTILETGYDPHCGQNGSLNSSGCQNLTADFYLQIVYTSAAEFPGIIITLIIIEIIGRKITISLEFVGTAIFFGIILICVPNAVLTVFLFGARAFVTGVFQAVYVYTPEVFPTKVRGIAMGIMTSAARIGALITPFIAQALFPVSDYATIILYSGSAAILVVLALLLPIETKGRSLKDTKG